MDVDLWADRMKFEEREGWWDWIEKIPTIIFPGDWEVKIIPPFGGAMARFLVLAEQKRISVYLDLFERLGCYGAPYWEIYPYENDVGRCAMEDTARLITMITEELNRAPTAQEGD